MFENQSRAEIGKNFLWTTVFLCVLVGFGWLVWHEHILMNRAVYHVVSGIIFLLGLLGIITWASYLFALFKK